MYPNHTTPNEVPLKRCSKCKELKPATSEYFHRKSSEKGGFRPRCKACVNRAPMHDVSLPEGHKVCTACNQIKPATLEYFHVGKRYKGGLRASCIACEKAYYAANGEHFRGQKRLYRVANKEKVQERIRAWARANTEYRAEYNRVYCATHKQEILVQKRIYNAATIEKRRERSKNYRIANREHIAEKLRQWRATHKEHTREYWSRNKDKVSAKNRRRRARKANATGRHTAADIKRQYKAQKGKCYYCSIRVGDTYHVDHVIPLSRGGSDGPENLVIACVPCNLSKKDKMPHEWAGSNRLL